MFTFQHMVLLIGFYIVHLLHWFVRYSSIAFWLLFSGFYQSYLLQGEQCSNLVYCSESVVTIINSITIKEQQDQIGFS